MRRSVYLLYAAMLLALECSFTQCLYAQELSAGPYLQRATPRSIWVHWEVDGNHAGRVRWSEDEALDRLTAAEGTPSVEGHWLYSAHLRELRPDTTYYYQIVQGDLIGEIYHFKTPALPQTEAPFRLIAMSDMQIDLDRPDQFRSVIDDGVIDYIAQTYSADLAREIDLLLIPGDLVKNGLSYTQWIDDFFAPARSLLPYVPVYPVPGNHENNSPLFFQYFNLPLNGTPSFEEHWYFFDQGNVRIIGLDSNGIYRNNVQLNWLVEVLDATCALPEIDFVFAQLHHPHHSELWPDGNTHFTGVVIEKLEDFSARCDKPSVHFYGHTHGYSRGHARDHRHVMVNVASAGGNLDEWGEYAQVDYPEHVVSQDEYGFVVVDVEAGDDPAFEIQRLSMGTVSEPRDHELRDRLRIRRFNQPPAQPNARGELGQEVNPRCFTLALSPFVDPDGDLHGATQWQVFADCDELSAPLVDRWRQRENWYRGVDLQASDDLSDEVIEDLIPNQEYCWRARYRDEGLSWSAWSAPQTFQTANLEQISYQLNNPGAEEGTAGWVIERGVFESLAEMECNGVSPFEGQRYFVVGGLCDASERAQVSQTFDLSPWRDRIERQELYVTLEAHARNWSGSDLPELGLSFLDANGALLAGAARTQTTEDVWTRLRVSGLAPLEAMSAKITLYGTRRAGSDNDSYFDAIKVGLTLGSALCDPPPEARSTESPIGDELDMGVASAEEMTAEVSGDGGLTDQGASDASLRSETDISQLDSAQSDVSMNRRGDATTDIDYMNSVYDESSSRSGSSGCVVDRSPDTTPSLLLFTLLFIRAMRRRARGQSRASAERRYGGHHTLI